MNSKRKPAPSSTKRTVILVVFALLGAVSGLAGARHSIATSVTVASARPWPQIVVTSGTVSYGVGGPKRSAPDALDDLRAFSGKLFLEKGLVPDDHLIPESKVVKDLANILLITVAHYHGDNRYRKDDRFGGYIKIIVDRRATMGTVGQAVNTARLCGFSQVDVVMAPNAIDEGPYTGDADRDPESI